MNKLKVFVAAALVCLLAAMVWAGPRKAYVIPFRYPDQAKSWTHAVGDTVIGTTADTVFMSLARGDLYPKTVGIWIRTVNINTQDSTVIKYAKGLNGKYDESYAVLDTVRPGGAELDTTRFMEIRLDVGQEPATNLALRIVNGGGVTAATDSFSYTLRVVGFYEDE